jgi:hypothetical protein
MGKTQRWAAVGLFLLTVLVLVPLAISASASGMAGVC